MMFISFEGIDCSGKSTQCKLLGNFLSYKGYKVLHLREPGGTTISEKIRDLLLDKTNHKMRGLTEYLLYSSARAQLVDEVIKPALARGEVIICDRYCDSSTAYQGFARGLGVDIVEAINKVATYGVMPELTIFVDIPIDMALARLRAKDRLNDRIEAEGSTFFEQVRQGYLQIATREKNRFKVVDGVDDIAIVEQKIRNIVVEKYGIT
jgi:dTMP kinase